MSAKHEFASLNRAAATAFLALSTMQAALLGFGVSEDPFSNSGVAQRWDAAPRKLENGSERSLDGGLRYSIEGGSYAAFKKEFAWDGMIPSDAELQAAIQASFDAWTEVDPGIGLGTHLKFVPDFAVVPSLDDNTTGAEIDLFGENLGGGFQGLATMSAEGPTNVTLTSGTVIEDTLVYNGAQIQINTHDVKWTLDIFQTTLTHEIGHTLGLDDVELAGIKGTFIDDNFDATDAATIQDSLTNGFSALIDPFAPENSASISRFRIDPNLFDVGLQTGFSFEPHLLMESAGDPDTDFRAGLDADSFAGRQYLYPSVPRSGDFDEDGELDVDDVNLLMSQIGTGEFDEAFDLNLDLAVSTDDLSLWVGTLKNTYFGDANFDAEFNSGDLITVLSAGEYEDDIPGNSGWEEGDFNADGDFTTTDLIAALADGGYENGPHAAAVSVPEPPSTLVFLVSLAIVGVFDCFRMDRSGSLKV